MEPEPSPETIIEAELIENEPRYEINLKKDNESNIGEIQIFIKEKTNEIIYEKFISINDDFWNEIKNKFQNNFNVFYVILESALIKKTNGSLYSEIILENFVKHKIRLDLHYTSELFGFDITIHLNKQKEIIDILKEENYDLKKRVESLEEKVESICKIVDIMGPQYMRSIIGADKIYANYNFLGTISSNSLGNAKLHNLIPGYSGAPTEPVKYLDELIGCEKSHSTNGKFIVNKKNGMEWDNSNSPRSGGLPDALVWSKTAWELIKKEKQWNID